MNIRLEATALGASTRSRIATAALHVSGDESFETTIDVAQYIAGGEVRFRYVPGIKTGTLTVAIDALASDGTIVASGFAGPFQLMARGIDVPVVLGAPSMPDMAMPDLAPLPQGAGCSSSEQCGTAGGCVDGFCCDTTCTGTCFACNVSGKEGTCSPVVAGFTPPAGHGSCGPDPASTCMRNGACDGMGSCQLFAAGTVCAPSMCSSGMYTPKSVCDGKGACQTPATLSCAPYICQDATTCYSNCTSNAQCAAPNTCANPGPNGSCGLKSLAAPCSGDAQCSSGHCAPEGICCDQACTGQCQYCESGTGACKYTSGAPASPRAACNGQGTAPCGGTCNGSSPSCTYPGNTTSCGQTANCGQAIDLHYYSTAPGSCNGNGSCQQTVTDCGKYACAGCLFGGGNWCCATVCSSSNGCNTSLGYSCNTSTNMCQ